MSQDLQPSGGSQGERSLVRRVLRAPLVPLTAAGRFIRERQKVFMPIGIIAAAIAFSGVLIALKPSPEKKDPEPVSMLVEVMPATHETVDYVITTQGTVLPRTKTNLVVEVAGKCTAVVRLLAAGLYDKPGISPPEMLGREPDCLKFILDRLEERYVELSLDSRVPKGNTG